MTVHVIVNPVAGRGDGKRLLPHLRSLFRESAGVEFTPTRSAGDEERLAQIAISRGAHTIMVVGGDGTCSGVANAILAANSNCKLGVFPCGTGNDFAKTLGVADYAPEQIVSLMQSKTPLLMDVGLAEGRYFLNSSGFGFDASVLQASNRIRFLKGNAVYIYSALTQLFTYRGTEVFVNHVPGLEHGQMLMITVSIGRFLGGAFKIAPRASVLDGKLDVCILGDSNVVRRVRLFLGAMRGTHIGMPSVTTARVEDLALTFAANPYMEMDGELRRARSTTVNLRCVPRALSVVAAPGAIV
jgi:lipid kinase, YegS/Rv2252/BmrU family